MKAMILAAGLGTRMDPLTRTYAKPALTVLDQPVIARMIESLAHAGISGFVINTHANMDSLREALGHSRANVEISEERTLLGTGGGIRLAEPYLGGNEPFIVLNSDMHVDLDVDALLAAHKKQGAIATLVLRDDPRKERFGSLGINSSEKVCRVTDLWAEGAEVRSGLFTGIQVLEPTIFDEMPASGCFDIIRDVHLPYLDNGGSIGTWLQPAARDWSPIGCPRELLDANLDALEALAHQEPAARGVFIDPTATVDGHIAGPVWIGAGAKVSPSSSVGPRAIIGAGANVPTGASVTDAVFLRNASPASPRSWQRVIAYGEEVWLDG